MNIVSFTNEKFVPGLVCLYKSIVLNSGLDKFTFTAVTKDISNQSEKIIDALGPIRRVNIGEIDEGELTTDLTGKKRLFLDKLSIFNLTDIDDALYIDADVICLGPLNELKKIDYMSMVPNIGTTAGRPFGSGLEYNTGVIKFRPDNNLYRDIVDTSNHMPADIAARNGDQGVINYYINKNNLPVKSLHPVYNLIISNKSINKSFYRDVVSQGVRLLHFTAMKPWLSGRGLNPTHAVSRAYLNVKGRMERFKYAKEIESWENIHDQDIRYSPEALPR